MLRDQYLPMDGSIEIGPETPASDKLDRSAKKWHFALLSILTAVIAAMYVPVLAALFRAFWEEPRLSQGLLIIPLCVYVGWLHRHALTAEPPVPHWTGLAVIFIAALLYVTGKVAAELFLPRLSFVVLLAGLTLWFWGARRLRILAFPLLLAATAIPLPAILYNRASASLQLLASSAAALVAQMFGVAVFQDGNVIHLARMTFGIEEACNGLTALSSLVATGLLLGLVTTTRLPVRVLIAAASIPLAVGINIVRVAGTAILATHSPNIALGFYHSFSGWLVFVSGVGALYLTARCLDQTYAYLERRKNSL